ncbi:MAG: DegV family protein [Firmicutes bacterium]|nr:DegV family protein [Bacillota bacterium]
MEKIIITTDSASDLTAALYKEYDIKVVPLTVVFGDKECKDGIDCQPSDIYTFVDKSGKLPSTSAVSQHEFEEFFKTHTAGGAKVIHISLSDALSLTYKNAKAVADQMKDVYVVDSCRLSMAVGFIAMLAKMQVNKGKTAKEVVEFLEKVKSDVQVSFVIDTLKFLHKGGRCSATKRLMTMVLPIKPEIVLTKEGKMESGAKYFGNIKKSLDKYTTDILNKYPNANKEYAIVTHTEIDQSITDEIVARLKKAGFKNVYDTLAGTTITTHCGKNTLGILIYNNSEL